MLTHYENHLAYHQALACFTIAMLHHLYLFGMTHCVLMGKASFWIKFVPATFCFAELRDNLACRGLMLRKSPDKLSGVGCCHANASHLLVHFGLTHCVLMRASF
jgi:hypothetical protein